MKTAFDPGVPLAHYRQHGGGVRLTCIGCMRHRDLPMEPMTRRVEARGVGNGQTGIRAVAVFVRDPCPACGVRKFVTAPWFPVERKGMGWRAGGETGSGAGGERPGLRAAPADVAQ